MSSSFNIVTVLLFFLTLATTTIFFLFVPIVALTIGVFLAGCLLCASPRMVREWERGVVLRLGKFRSVLTPGISWVIPGFDVVTAITDMRIRSTPFSAEKTLTQDTVPVNVDAVLFWVVTDAKRAILEVEGYQATISWIAQTTLRDVIGKTQLQGMISNREELDAELQTIIDEKTSEWGITVQSVEIRDVVIPSELEDAMSRKAQADRERDARIILSESELKVAEQMEQAAQVYSHNGVAMQLRAMNMTYESIKENGALMVIPSDMVSSTSMNGIMGLAGSVVTPNQKSEE